jgi:N-dimethylarginine dimethylaminohydrolase
MTTAFETEKCNGHSMVGTLRKVMICSPKAAGWQDPARVTLSRELGFPHPPDFDVALAQHRTLREILFKAAVDVFDLPASPDLSLDAAYAHDASLPTDYGLVLMRPGKPNRVTETARHREFCVSLGISVLGEIQAPGTSEAGDMIWIDSRTLLIGHGYRTNPAGIAQMREMLSPHGVEVLTAPLPYGPGPSACLHLMSLISLLDEKTALVDLPWMAVETVELLRLRGYRFIEIDAAERDTLACNVLALGDGRLVAIEENRKTNQRLRETGFKVHTFPGSEICINGAGGPTCLTRPLLRGDS